MSIWELAALFFRRWWVALPLATLSVGAVVVAKHEVKPDYLATSFVVLVPPPATPYVRGQLAQEMRNQFLNGHPYLLANAAISQVNVQSTADMLVEAGLSDSFTVDVENPSGRTTFNVVALSADQAAQTMDAILKLYDGALLTLQRSVGAPTADLITPLVVGDPLNLVQADGKIKRTLAAVGLTGLLITVSAVVAVDVLARRRGDEDATPVTAEGAEAATT